MIESARPELELQIIQQLSSAVIELRNVASGEQASDVVEDEAWMAVPGRRNAKFFGYKIVRQQSAF